MSTATEQEIPTPIADSLFRRASSPNPEKDLTSYILAVAALEKEIWETLRRLEKENTALKAQAALDTVRFREMQEAGARLEADSKILDWLLGDGCDGCYFMDRDEIASAMQKEQAP